MSDQQQLVARIKRNSKYFGQTAPNQWFEARVVADTFYQIRGNSNNYRLCDVAIGMQLADGSILDLTNGKVSRSKAAPRRFRRPGGPTVREPDRPYCKPDQSCCDFACGN